MLCPRVVLMAVVVLPVLASCLAKDSGRPVGHRCTGDGQCRSGLHCVYGRCRQPCTTDRDCDIGAVCVPSKDDPSIYVCTLPDEGSGNGCPDGLTADSEGTCRRPCDPTGPQPDAPCGPAQTCDQGWCHASGVGDAGAPGGGDSGMDGSATPDGSVDSGVDGGPDSGGDSSVADGGADVGTDGRGDAGGDVGPPGSLEWVAILGGVFNMGSDGWDDDQAPVHSVTVPPFEMLRTEVTVRQYGECVTAGSCTAPETWERANWNDPGYEDHPVNYIDWQQAVEFCTWAGGRLPSEAEWEYAARSGGLDQEYPWGNEAATCEYVVHNEGGEEGCGTGRTWPVCSKPAGNTAQELCDMAGNVFEWVQDWWHADYTGAPNDGSAWEDPNGARVKGVLVRVNRGGSFDYASSAGLRAAFRVHWNPASYSLNLGARCAR